MHMPGLERVMFWLNPQHGLFPLKGIFNDPNTTFFILLFLINSASFSLKGLDFGTSSQAPPPELNPNSWAYGLELMSLSVLYGFRELRVVLGTRILRAAAVCSVHGSLSPLQFSMHIVQIPSTALHDANDALLGVHCITRITRSHFHCFSNPRFGALSPTKLRVHPLKLCLLAASPPTPPQLTSFALKAQA